MKSKFLLLATVLSIAFFSGCLRDECTSEQTYVRFDPVYKTIDEIRTNLTVEAARALKNPGKIYALGNLLFINEKQEGIHVIDNTDPANPQNIAFWNLPGNVDMVIQDNFLYADQYVDLVTIDISNLQSPTIVCRTESVFPLFGFDPANGFIVDYKETSVTERVKCGDVHANEPWFREGDLIFVANEAMIDLADASGGGTTNVLKGIGVAGSFARFGLASNYLYTVDNFQMRTWSLGNPSCPIRTDSVWLGWNAETIFPFKDRLFVGSQTGVFIFNNTNPAHPVWEASFDHASGCDPVVCDDNYAYVTIHDGTTCNGTLNQLDVVDIKNLPAATLQSSYAMTRPFGLSITNEHLFLCDDGLKIFDKTNPVDLKLISHQKGMDAYDVIAFSDSHLMLIGADGFFQFDVSDPASPKQLSLIPVEQ
jgi:hypothetical protein